MELKPGYKQTEIGVIPDDWETVSLGEHASFRTGPFGSALHKSDYVKDGIPVVNPMHIVGGEILPSSAMTISESAAHSLAEFRLRQGEIVIGRRGDIGRCAVVQSHQSGWLCGTGSMIVRPTGFNSHFLQLVLSSDAVVSEIVNNSVGTTMVNLNQGSLSNLKVQHPPRAEQSAIATALGDMDALLSALDALIEKKRVVKQGVTQELLTGKRRLPGFDTGWRSHRLGELAKIQRGASPRPIDSPHWFDEKSKVGWVRISDVTNSGMYLEETTQSLSQEGIRHSRLVPTGSLIMSICATVGRPIITKIDACIHDGFVVFDDVRADRKFLYYVLKWIEPNWSKRGQTGSQMNLNTGLISATEVTLPATEEQAAIAEALSEMDAEITALEAKKEKTLLLKQGMMQELLTGRIRLV